MSKKTMKHWLLIMLAVSLSVSLSFPAARAADVVHVQSGSSIQTAIDAAPAGATIELAKGEWRENLMIGKSISILGTGATDTIIRGTLDGHPVISISPEGVQTVSVTISGIAVSAGGSNCADAGVCADGILASGRARITVDDVTITGSYAGIRLTSYAEATITRSTLSGDTYGVIIAGLAKAKITYCTISENGEDGVIIADYARVKLSDNNIINNGRTGISVDLPACYNTTRSFNGLIIGDNNTIPGPSEDDGNVIAVCPSGLSAIATRVGGFYPAAAAETLLSLLPAAPPMEGHEDAPVTIIEFTDFTCSYCNRFAGETLPRIEADYVDKGKVKIYFLPFPVHGEGAHLAAEAAFCAQEQGLFWDFQRLLIAQYVARGETVLTPNWLTAIAAATGADHDRFFNSLTEGTYAFAVQESVALGRELGVDGTPTFFINGREIPGAAPYEVFAQMIDAELAEK